MKRLISLALGLLLATQAGAVVKNQPPGAGGGGGSGTVQSVDATAVAPLCVAGGPITISGTLTFTWCGAQTANQFLATPNGSTGAASLRSIVVADLPTVNGNVGSFTYGSFTVNAQGLITAASSGAAPAAGANPSASVGLTAVNGTATTFLRSDGSPALSQAIVPTWTGVHTFSATPVLNAGLTLTNAANAYAETVTGSVTSGTTGFGRNITGTVNDASAVDGVIDFANITCTLCTASTNLVDWQVGSVSKFKVDTGGNTSIVGQFTLSTNNQTIAWTGGESISGPTAGQLNLGPGIASGTPVNQTLASINSIGGTSSNVAGANLTIRSGLGTGTAAGSTLSLQVPLATTAGTTQQAATTELSLSTTAITLGDATNQPATTLNGTTVTVPHTLTLSGISGSTQCLNVNTSGVVSGTGAVCGGSGSTGANPTASVGLAAVNGVATTFLRSDGSPALSQSIVPTWTGVHTFSATPVLSAGLTLTNAANAFTQTSTGLSLTSGTTGFGRNIVGTVNDASAVDGIIDFANILCTTCTSTSYLVDWQVGSVSKFKVDTTGAGTFAGALNVTGQSNLANIVANNTSTISWSGRGTLSSPAAGGVQLGSTNSATPTAQTLSTQGSRGGTDTNVAGANVIFQSGAGTGNAAGSTLSLGTPHATTTGTAQQTINTQILLGDNTITLPQITGSTQCLNVNTSGVLTGTGSACGGAGSTGANPTASVGLAAVNGVATTFLRSDGAPALSQSITPTWTGLHTFTNSDIALLGSSTGTTTFTSDNAGATNFTLHVPAANDTIAALAATQAFTNKTYNGNTWTSGTGTLTIGAGKTLGASNTLSFAGTDSTTFTFPAINGTVDVLNNAATYTAAKTFTNSDLLLLGSSTGATTFTSANAGASNFTATVPANTGTIAELNLAQSFTATQTFAGVTLGGITGSTQCLNVNSSGVVSGTGAGCASAPAFSAVTAGTNTAALVVGTGGTLTTSGTGTINANLVNGAIVPASAALLASNSSNQETAVTLGNNLAISSGTLQTTQVINAQTGTTYAILGTDSGKLITASNAASQAYSIAQAGTTGFTTGYSFDIQNKGAGTVTITPTTSTVNGASTLVIATNLGCTVTSDGTNYQVSACTAVAPAGGVSAPTQNAQAGNYTFVLGDANSVQVYHTSGTAHTWTIPANSSVAYPVGTILTGINETGGGVLTIAITTDTLIWSPTGTTGSRSVAATGMFTAVKVTSTSWIITGSGVS